MTPIELSNRFDAVIKDMEGQAFGNIMASIASNALTTIRARVQETGVDADGNKFRSYSTSPMLANCSGMTSSACSRVAGSKDKRKNLKWVTLNRVSKTGKKIRLFEIPGGYKEYRELHGRQTDHVDFVFSGRMWSNIKVIGSVSELNSGIARIGATTQEDNDVLAGNTKRRDNILAMSNTEIKDIAADFGIALRQIFRKNGL